MKRHVFSTAAFSGALLAAASFATPAVAQERFITMMVTTEVANIRLEQTLGWALLFVVAMGCALALVALFPALALWLPTILGYNV